jgi:GT2 family glycosyltransferase
VWDNNSREEPDPKDFPEIDLVLSKKNDGFALGYNKAVSYAIRMHKPEYIIVLNNDTRITKGMIPELIQACKKRKNTCVVVPKIYFEHGHEFYKKSYSKDERGHVLWYAGGDMDAVNILPFHRGVDEVDRGQFDLSEETLFVTGCCFCLTPKVWKKIGGFDPAYFMYYEDIDFSVRATKKGIPLVYVPTASLYHVNAGSTQGSGSLFQQYYQTRNRLRFGLQYGKPRTKLALLREAWNMWKVGNEGERWGVLHALEGRWGNQTAILTQKP